MINSITITNHLNQSITMEMRFPEKSGFLVENIEGLDPSKADISLSDVSGTDGAIYNSARVNSRNIVFILQFLEDPSIEDVRQKTYKYFPLKRRIKITVETDNRISEVYGYVESNEINIFSDKEGAVISVICPEAYLFAKDIQLTFFSNTVPKFSFPFSNESLVAKLILISQLDTESIKDVCYLGDAPIGISISIHAIGPANDVSITNILTSESISIDSAKLIAITGSDIILGDDIIISTVKGDKYAILIRGGTTYNILNALGQNPDWFLIESGDNIFSFTADTGILNLQFKIENAIYYQGI